MDKRLITRQEAADAAGVTTRTISRWAAAGKITLYKSRAGHARFELRDVLSALEPEAVTR